MADGVSVGASVKSRKLQQRNAILRSTGFIEGPACVKGVGGIASAAQFLVGPMLADLLLASVLVGVCNYAPA